MRDLYWLGLSIHIQYWICDGCGSGRIWLSLYRGPVSHGSIGLVPHGMRCISEILQETVGGMGVVISSVHEASIVVHNDYIVIGQSFTAGARLLHGHQSSGRSTDLAQRSNMTSIFIRQTELAPSTYLSYGIEGAPDIWLNGIEDTFDAKVLDRRQLRRGLTAPGAACEGEWP